MFVYLNEHSSCVSNNKSKNFHCNDHRNYYLFKNDRAHWGKCFQHRKTISEFPALKLIRNALRKGSFIYLLPEGWLKYFSLTLLSFQFWNTTERWKNVLPAFSFLNIFLEKRLFYYLHSLWPSRCPAILLQFFSSKYKMLFRVHF